MSSTVRTLPGGCLCGAIRYEMDVAAEEASTCHCTMCRRQSGGAFMTFVTIPRTRFRLLTGTIRYYRSSDFARRGFCADCGTPVTFEYDFETDALGVTTGSLDDPDAIPPAAHWGVESMLAWLKLDDGLPRRTTSEDPDVAAALARPGPGERA